MRPGLRACAVPAVVVLATALSGCGRDERSPERPPIVTVVQDDAELLHRSPARIAATLDDMRDVGVDWVRVTAGWSVIAPAPLKTIRRGRFGCAATTASGHR